MVSRNLITPLGVMVAKSVPLLCGPEKRMAPVSATRIPALRKVKAVAVAALAHRLVLRPELWVQRISAEDVVRDVLARVPTPPAEDLSGAR